MSDIKDKPRRRTAPVLRKRSARLLVASLASSLVVASLGACASALKVDRGSSAAPVAPARVIPGWDALPPPARSFALEFARRVEAGDWAWVANRADAQFAAANGIEAGRAPDGLVAARLVRAGAYADETGSEYETLRPLPLGISMRVAFDEAKLKGPIVVLYGRFRAPRMADIPFSLRLAWQLDEPQLVGSLR
jgi:hypothetical protein